MYDTGKDVFEELQGEGIPLGADGSWVYAQSTRAGSLKEQIILIGTDGIWEARGPDGDMFGKARFKEIIRREAAHPASAILDAVYRELRAFSSGYKAEDDITLVVIKIEKACGKRS